MERSPTLLDQVLDVLRSYQDAARALGFELVGVVGSVARGEARPDSDVDLVYDVVGEGGLWAFLGLTADIEDQLGRRIDLVDREMMVPDRWLWMSRDLVPL